MISAFSDLSTKWCGTALQATFEIADLASGSSRGQFEWADGGVLQPNTSTHPARLEGPRSPLISAPNLTLLPRNCRHVSKATFTELGTPPTDGTGQRSECVLTTRSSRFSAFTISATAGSAEECFPRQDEAVHEASSTKASSSAERSSLPLFSSIDDVLSDHQQPAMLYPWEVDAMAAQAAVVSNAISQSLSRSLSDRVSERSGECFAGDYQDMFGDMAFGGGVVTGQGQPARMHRLSSAGVGGTSTFRVSLHRREDRQLLGLDTRCLVSEVVGALHISRIRAGGLVDEWNQSRRSQGDTTRKRRHRIKKGDLIIDVNGLRQNSESMCEAIVTEQSLRLVVLRLPQIVREV